MTKKRQWQFQLLLFLTLFFCFSVSALATDFTYNGSSNSTGGSGIPSKNASFVVHHTDYRDIVAYRFSVLDVSNHKMGRSVDVYDSSWDAYTHSYLQLHGVNGQHCKQEWATKSLSLNDNYTISQCGFTTLSAFGGLPQNPADIEWWLSNNSYANTRAMFRACGLGNAIPSGYHLIVEPVFLCKINNVPCAYTNTELAVYGGAIYGYNSTKGSGNQNTFGYISHAVLQWFPNMLRDESQDIFNAAPQLNRDATYGTIIHSGYGVASIYTKNIIHQLPKGGFEFGVHYLSDNSPAQWVYFDLYGDVNCQNHIAKLCTNGSGSTWYGVDYSGGSMQYTLTPGEKYYLRYSWNGRKGSKLSPNQVVEFIVPSGTRSWTDLYLDDRKGGFEFGVHYLSDNSPAQWVYFDLYGDVNCQNHIAKLCTNGSGSTWYGVDYSTGEKVYILNPGSKYYLKYAENGRPGSQLSPNEIIEFVVPSGTHSWTDIYLDDRKGGIGVRPINEASKQGNLRFGIYTNPECTKLEAEITTETWNGARWYGTTDSNDGRPYKLIPGAKYYVKYLGGAPAGTVVNLKTSELIVKPDQVIWADYIVQSHAGWIKNWCLLENSGKKENYDDFTGIPGAVFGLYTDFECTKPYLDKFVSNHVGSTWIGYVDGQGGTIPAGTTLYVRLEQNPKGYVVEAADRQRSNNCTVLNKSTISIFFDGSGNPEIPIFIAKPFVETYKLIIPEFIEVTTDKEPPVLNQVSIMRENLSIPSGYALNVKMQYSQQLKHNNAPHIVLNYTLYNANKNIALQREDFIAKNIQTFPGNPTEQSVPLFKFYGKLDKTSDVRYAGNYSDTITFISAIEPIE